MSMKPKPRWMPPIRVGDLFRTNRIKVHASCVNLISELESYAFPDRKPGHDEPETPVKENDTACHALRYALFMNAQGGTGFIPPPTLGLVQRFPGLGG